MKMGFTKFIKYCLQTSKIFRIQSMYVNMLDFLSISFQEAFMFSVYVALLQLDNLSACILISDLSLLNS